MATYFFIWWVCDAWSLGTFDILGAYVFRDGSIGVSFFSERMGGFYNALMIIKLIGNWTIKNDLVFLSI
jgi:hypothetical protein